MHVIFEIVFAYEDSNAVPLEIEADFVPIINEHALKHITFEVEYAVFEFTTRNETKSVPTF